MIVEDYKDLQKYYNKLQSRIDAAELLGFDITEYEKASYGMFYFRKSHRISGNDKIIIKPPQSKTYDSNFRFPINCDLIESKKE